MAEANLASILETLQAARNRQVFRKLDFFRPYVKQQEFLDLGATYRERLLMAGNKNGKTYTGAAETAIHLTGEYPDDWFGRRWDRPIVAWAAGETGEVVRDVQQNLLCGPPGVDSMLGSGMIPRDTFHDKPSLARGVTDLFDTIQIKHKAGGISVLKLKSYAQGRKHFQGSDVDFIWFDEEPEEDIYSEGLTRTVAVGGCAIMTFTPLLGMSKVVRRFLEPDDGVKRGIVRMDIADALHIPPEKRAEIMAAYPAHEREARSHGIPMLGSGKIYQVPQSNISEPMIEDVPVQWVKLWGLDFGIGDTHPFAAVLIAWDKDLDVIHVLHAIKIVGALPLQHSVPIKAVAAAVPIAWPHDGNNRDKGTGETLAGVYRKYPQQLPMLPMHATWPEGGNSVEAGIQEIQDRMQTGRFKVASHLVEWFKEFHGYHRKDGQIVKAWDDVMDATRYAVMMKRYAKAMPLGNKARKRGRPGEGTMAVGIDFDLS